MEILHEAGADILLIETQPSLHEALLAADIAEELRADYWISFSCMDEKHICEGDLIRDCAKVFARDHLQMIGVNCSRPGESQGRFFDSSDGLTGTIPQIHQADRTNPGSVPNRKKYSGFSTYWGIRIYGCIYRFFICDR